ncbi:MAG: BrnT family toxin [Pyrinomonadaceae bacterium]
MDKDPAKEKSNIAKRGLSLDLVEQLNWGTALFWEEARKEYGEQRYCVLGFLGDRLHSIV